MIVVAIAFLAAAQLPGAVASAQGRGDTTQTTVAAAVTPPDTGLARAPVDTPITRRRRAIQYSDQYYTRLTIHRYASYTMLPLFAAEYALGQNLINDASPSPWIRPTHGVVAAGVGVLFGLNTITGVWNLWDSRADPSGKTRRVVHSALMLASDAGFALTGALAPSHHHFYTNYADYQNRVNLHRNVAIGSMALSTIGWGMMLLWKQ